jgi:hypothetical protein
MNAVRMKIKASGLADVIDLVGCAPWAILAFKDHPLASKEAVKTLLLREMIACGVLINSSHNLCFAHSPADIGRVLTAYDHALAMVREALACGDINRRLGNRVIRPIFTVRAAS